MTPFFRLGGNGLANSLFVFARALLFADRSGLELIDPPWLNIEKAPWLRGDKDKRLYAGLFRSVNEFDFSNCVAVHVRRGDYAADWRTPTDWYETIIRQVATISPDTRFLLFLTERTRNWPRYWPCRISSPVFFGNALADIWAISRCRALIRSMSTFSDWSAFVGQIPVILPNPPQFGNYFRMERKSSFLTMPAERLILLHF